MSAGARAGSSRYIPGIAGFTGHEMSVTGNDPVLPRSPDLARELHVWLANPDGITDPVVLERYLALLSTEERERSRKFRFARDRHLYLVSHALVRMTLSRYVALPPSEWRFAVNPHGKPEIANPELPVRLRFSLSHTHGLAACLVVLDQDCGVDVEAISSRRDVTGIAARHFTEQERQQLDRLDGADALQQFFAFWTLREAYGKARGSGLAHIGDATGFAGAGPGVYSLRRGAVADPGDWQLQVLHPVNGYVLALAVRRAPSGDRAVVTRWADP